MNNKIQELADQSLFSNYDNGWSWKADDDDLQEFAGLIVRESLVDFYRNYLDTTSGEDITVQVARYVRDTLELNDDRHDLGDTPGK